MRIRPWLCGVAVVLGLSMARSSRAELRVPKLFSDHMVLQRDMATPVWGWADPGTRITVRFLDQTKTAVAGNDGRWMIKLDPLKASTTPANLTISIADPAAPGGTLTFSDVLVGDVWVCAGQSNMEFGLNGSDNAREAVPGATNSLIRLLQSKGPMTPAPQQDVEGPWSVCQPQAAAGFSAVGYFFGKTVQETTGIPIGLVNVAWGGTGIELWMNPAVGGFSGIYNGRVAPLVPFGIKGALWYQGESNGDDGNNYYDKMRALIRGWRQVWNQGEFAFYFVQLASNDPPNDDPAGGNGWARIRMAQLNSLKIPHTGMAVAIDVGATNNIHPRNKEDVGHRLALWALKNDYGRTALVCSGPLYKDMTVDGGKIKISFDYVGSGLMVGKKEGHGPAVAAKEGKLQRFAIAGADKKWFWAEAVIDGGCVVVSSPSVPAPAAVRYAFSQNPAGANLYNKEGLPASPFRTDDW